MLKIQPTNSLAVNNDVTIASMAIEIDNDVKLYGDADLIYQLLIFFCERKLQVAAEPVIRPRNEHRDGILKGILLVSEDVPTTVNDLCRFLQTKKYECHFEIRCPDRTVIINQTIPQGELFALLEDNRQFVWPIHLNRKGNL